MTLQDHVAKGFWNFMKGSSSLYVITLPSLVSVVIMMLEIWHICFVLWHALKHDQRGFWFYGRKLFVVRNHRARICCHLHCGTADIIFQIYHMTSLDQVLKVLSNFVRPRDLSVSWLYWNKLIIACLHSAKFGSHRHYGSEYIKILVFKWSSKITWLYGQETCRKQSR